MIIDIIVIVLIVLGALLGYKKGLVGILISLASLILAIVLAFMLQTPIAQELYQTEIGSGVNKTVTDMVEKTISGKTEEERKNNAQTGNFFDKMIENATTKEQIASASKEITMFILKGVSFIGIFILVFIICYILRMVLNLVCELPILHGLNKWGGLVAGGLQAVIKILLLLAIISFISVLPMVKVITDSIQKTNFTKQLYENNFFVKIIESNTKK